MKIQIAFVSLAFAATSVAACGDDATSSGATTSAAGTSAGADSTVVATDASTTALPTTTAITAPPGPQLYEQVDPAKMPDEATDYYEADQPLDDGAYWAVYNGGDTHSANVTLFFALFGQYCLDYVEDMNILYMANIECDVNGMFVPPEFGYDTMYPGDPAPVVDLPFADDVFLTVADASTQLSYWITPEEFLQLRDSAPSAGAPAGYTYVPFDFYMTIKDGVIVKFEQVWVP